MRCNTCCWLHLPDHDTVCLVCLPIAHILIKLGHATAYQGLSCIHESGAPTFRQQLQSELLHAGVCQREVTQHFPALADQQDELEESILEFFEEHIQHKFPDPDCRCLRSSHMGFHALQIHESSPQFTVLAPLI